MTTPQEQTAVQLGERGVVAVLRGSDPEAVAQRARALAGAGVTALEVTFSVPDAHEIIRDVAQLPDTLVGAGTVTTEAEAELALGADAAFLVSPAHPPFLLPFAADADRLAIPGTATPHEAFTALQAGALAIKVFPAAHLGGPDYLKALLAPFPGVRVMPTGGIGVADIPAYRAAGAWSIGLGSELARDPALARRAQALWRASA